MGGSLVGGGSVGGTGVSLGGTGVSVGGTGVSVGGMVVGVGGIGVRDGVRVRTLVGVRVGGLRVGVGLATITRVGGMRVLLTSVGVMVTKRLCVSVACGVREAGACVLVGVSVWVGTKTVTICSVRAAAVSKLETARSTMLIGSSLMGM